MRKISIHERTWLTFSGCLLLALGVVGLGCGGEKAASTELEPIDLDGGFSDGLLGGGGSFPGQGTAGSGGSNSGREGGAEQLPDAGGAAAGGTNAGGSTTTTGGTAGSGPVQPIILKAKIIPTAFQFGEVVFNQQTQSKTFALVNEGNVALPALVLSLSGIDSMEFALDAMSCTGRLSSGEECEFRVRYMPSEAGRHVAQVSVKSETIDIAVADLAGSAITGGNLELMPTSIVFGDQFVGASLSASASIRNPSSSAVTVTTRTSGDGNDFSLHESCLTSLMPGQTCNFSVSFAPKSSGNRVSSISFDAGPGGVVVLTLSGTGKGGSIELQPTSIDFGEAQRGSAKLFRVRVTADGLTAGNSIGPLLLEVPNGFYVSEDGCSRRSLAAGEVCEFNVGLSPSGPFGAVSAALRVTLPDTRSLVVNLKAVAKVPEQDSSLIGHWKFERNALDSTAYSNHGKLVRGTRLVEAESPAQFGIGSRGYFLSLADQRWMSVDPTESLSRPLRFGGLSASMWMRLGSSEGTGYALVWSTVSSSVLSFAIGAIPSDGIVFVQSSFYTLKSVPLSTQGWHHVAATFDGESLRLYVDGSSQGEAITPRLGGTAIRPLTIGAKPSSDDLHVENFFRGDLDDLRLYDRNLTDTEVLNDMKR